MRNKNNITLIFSITLLVSCGNKSHPVRSDEKFQILNVTGEKVFFLNNNTTARSKSISYNERDSIFASYTSYSNQITYFDYKSGSIIFENKLVKNPTGLFIVNQDSIFIFSLEKKQLYLIDKNNKLTFEISFDLSTDLKTFTVNPELTHSGPVIINGGKIYMCCWGLGEFPDKVKSRFDRPIIVELNPKTKARKYYSGYPQFYIGNNMGSFQNYILNHTFNPFSNEIVVSFMASCQMAVFDIDTKNEKMICAKSIYFDTIPLPHPGKDRNYSSDSESFYHYITQPFYERIIFDKYRRLYYRFVLHGVKKPDMTKGAKVYFDKEFSIIVMDENFKILGETQKYAGYNPRQSFVTKEGLHVLKLTKDENKATYSVFK